jgi:pyruvate dehydrogenase E1 component
MTSFAALARDYVNARSGPTGAVHRGRMVAIVGDAELDEGNVFEALLEGWKHDVRDVWWVIDYNRQSLDSVIADRLFSRFNRLFSSMGWRVVTLKYGKIQQAAFAKPGGEALRQWIDACTNSLYSALVFKGGAAWREQILQDIGRREFVTVLLDGYDDNQLSDLMTNLGGHDMECVLEAFESIDDSQPTCFIAYTIKGYGLPMAGHKDNHSGLMSEEQMETYRDELGVPDEREWDLFAGLDIGASTLRRFLDSTAFARGPGRRELTDGVALPDSLPVPRGDTLATQHAFGRILDGIARAGGELAEHIVTTSPDVTVSTGLGGWVNRRGVFDRRVQEDLFDRENVGSFQRWQASPDGQHLELGIAENNLFVLLAALGLTHSLFGYRLLPIGTLYDPFIQRGLDALNYACYQDARFMVVGTPSGLSLAPEGGAHQSTSTPLIGLAQNGLAAFEPAFADELAAIMTWGFQYMQADACGRIVANLLGDETGGSIYLRLSTRKIAQLDRQLDVEQSRQLLEGGYWLHKPRSDTPLILVYTGVVVTEVLAAFERLVDDYPGCGVLAITSADRLNGAWQAAQRCRESGEFETLSHLEQLLQVVPSEATLVTVCDGHPTTLSWIGAVGGHRVRALGVERFGQSGTVAELYRAYGLDADCIEKACRSVLKTSC